MTAISITGLSLSFGVTPILQDISFSLEENDRLGIIGVNGCGKSTLFRLILGEHTPDSGNVYIAKGKTVGILTQDGAFQEALLPNGERADTPILQMYTAFPHLLRAEERLAELQATLDAKSAENDPEALRIASEYTALNERFIREGGLEFRNRCASILSRMGFSAEMMNRPLDTLSGGQRTRLALSRELSREPDILLLDEPTNHLDIETLGWLEHYLLSYKKCVMVISHDRYFLDRVTNKTLAIEHHRAKLYNGSYSATVKQREIDRALQEKHYKDQQKEIARQEAYIAQQRQWNRERNIIAAESRQKLLDKMVRIEKPKEAPKAIRMQFTASSASGNEVLTANRLTMGFDGRILFRDLSFLVKKNERLFIVGQNGAGKSTLIKMMLGKIAPLSGYLEAGYNVEIGYYDQENQNLSPENTVLDELWNVYPTLPETQIRNTLALFRFEGEEVFKEVGLLSGGERARLTLAKLILSKMNLLILDEPTNHLDIDSREALEMALSSFDGTIITVSHDRYFMDKLATRVLEIAPAEISDRISCDYTVTRAGEGYTEYLEEREARLLRAGAQDPDTAPTATQSTQKEQYLKNKQAAAEERKQKARVERLKKESERLENELEEIEKEMFGDAATDYVRAAELDTRKNEIEERLLEIYEEIGL